MALVAVDSSITGTVTLDLTGLGSNLAAIMWWTETDNAGVLGAPAAIPSGATATLLSDSLAQFGGGGMRMYLITGLTATSGRTFTAPGTWGGGSAVLVVAVYSDVPSGDETNGAYGGAWGTAPMTFDFPDTLLEDIPTPDEGDRILSFDFNGANAIGVTGPGLVETSPAMGYGGLAHVLDNPRTGPTTDLVVTVSGDPPAHHTVTIRQAAGATPVSRDRTFPTEHVAPVAEDTTAPSEVIQPAAADQQLLSEHLRSVARDLVFPTEHRSEAGVAGDVTISTEVVGLASSSRILAGEHLQQAAGEATLPTESVLPVAVEDSVPTEHLTVVQADVTIPTELVGPGAALAADLVIPTEVVGTAAAELVLSTEHLVPVAAEGGAETEVLAGQVPTDLDLMTEHLTGLRAELVIPTEVLGPDAGSVAAELLIPTEHLSSPALLQLVGTEHLSPVEVEDTFPCEHLLPVELQDAAPSEALEGVAGQVVLSTEVIGPQAEAVSRDLVLPTEFLTGRVLEGAVPSEALSQASTARGIRTEHLTGGHQRVRQFGTEHLTRVLIELVIPSEIAPEFTTPVSLELLILTEHLRHLSRERAIPTEAWGPIGPSAAYSGFVHRATARNRTWRTP